eukprot:IDg942t1
MKRCAFRAVASTDLRAVGARRSFPMAISDALTKICVRAVVGVLSYLSPSSRGFRLAFCANDQKQPYFSRILASQSIVDIPSNGLCGPLGIPSSLIANAHRTVQKLIVLTHKSALSPNVPTWLGPGDRVSSMTVQCHGAQRVKVYKHGDGERQRVGRFVRSSHLEERGSLVAGETTEHDMFMYLYLYHIHTAMKCSVLVVAYTK